MDRRRTLATRLLTRRQRKAKTTRPQAERSRLRAGEGVRRLPRSRAHPRQHSSDEFGRIACRTSPRNDAGVRQSDDNQSVVALERPTRPPSQILLDMPVNPAGSAQLPANR